MNEKNLIQKTKAQLMGISPRVAGVITAVLVACPQLAYAADFKQTVNSITDQGNDVLTTVGYALLTLIAALALIAIAKEILPALFAREKPEMSSRVKAGVVVVVVCIIAAFVPTIINSLSTLAGTNVNLGQV